MGIWAFCLKAAWEIPEGGLTCPWATIWRELWEVWSLLWVWGALGIFTAVRDRLLTGVWELCTCALEGVWGISASWGFLWVPEVSGVLMGLLTGVSCLATARSKTGGIATLFGTIDGADWPRDVFGEIRD